MIRSAFNLTVGSLFVLALVAIDGRDVSSTEPVVVSDLPALDTRVPKSLGNVEHPLTYPWTVGHEVVYRFDMEATVGKRKIELNGRNSLQPTDARPNVVEDQAEETNGSGSGFVVHPQGVIVTCAHVVKGATRVLVRIDDEEHVATVIGFNMEADLAILRIDAHDLPYLTLADSDLVQLAQEVRVIGFPLSTVLGSSIKVTRGEVSGIGIPQNAKAFQIDATVNPGNSGGPLLDGSGRVVGVTSELLSGVGISEVGFAVPSNEVAALAKKLNIPIAISSDFTERPATEIVASAAPATVLLKVECGPGGVGIDDPRQVRYSCSWTETGSTTRDSNSPYRSALSILSAMPGFNHTNSRGRLVVDQLGQIIEVEKNEVAEDSVLPFMMGNAATIGIETLPTTGSGAMTSRKAIVVQHETQTSRADPFDFRSRYRLQTPWMRSRQSERANVKVYLGNETTTWTVGATEGQLVGLSKVYKMRVDGETKRDRPYIKMEGTGTGKFDKKIGLMRSMKFTATLTVRQDNVTLDIPVTMNYEMIDPAALAKERDDLRTQMQKIAAQRQSDSSQTAPKQPSSPAPASKSKYPSIKDLPLSSKLDQFDPDK